MICFVPSIHYQREATMNKHLQSEINEVQALLYFIIANQISGWMKVIFTLLGILAFIGAVFKKYQADKEQS
jgi:hypothetical protein